jgi:peptidoglycan/xylan/chitin deacetylase (PgdA/CDA1 family)
MKTKSAYIIILTLSLFRPDSSYSQNFVTNGNNQVISEIKISNWLAGAKAAVTFSWDDTNPAHAQIARVLEEFNFRGSFFVYPARYKWCLDTIKSVYPQIVANGHEIGNHTMNHKNLTTLPADELIREINEPDQIIYDATGYWPVSLVQPFNATNKFVDSVIFANHLFTRISSPYGMKNRILTGSIKTATTIEEMKTWIDSATSTGKWLNIAGHGIDSVGWEPITSDFLRETCKLIQGSVYPIWVGTLRQVGTYEYLKHEIKPEYSLSDSTVSIDLSGFDSLKYTAFKEIPFSLEIHPEKGVSLTLIENEPFSLQYREKDNTYILTFNLREYQHLMLHFDKELVNNTIRNNAEIRVFPNPAKDKIQIESDKKIIYLEIIDLTGRIMKKDYSNENEHLLLLSQLKNGIYFLHIYFTDGIYTRRFEILNDN